MLFIDTAYVFAVTNARDQWHGAAVGWQRHLTPRQPRYTTTEYVLVEIVDGLAAMRFRKHALLAVAAIRSNPKGDVVPASTALFDAALALYRIGRTKTGA